MPDGPRRLRIYADADVIMAAAGGDFYGAPSVLLVSANVAPITFVCAETAVLESRRNVKEKIPEALPDLNEIIEWTLMRVPDPETELEERFCDLADEKDAIHLATAVVYDCKYLVTYNESDYQPGHPEVTVVSPADLVKKLRATLPPAVFSEEIW